MGEALDAEHVRRLLSAYFVRMRSIVERHGGQVEKFIGDAVVAVFGVPVLHEDDALRAVRAAVEMRAALPELGLAGRIGVTTGEVVTGSDQALATGDAMNVAARLQHAAQPGEVLVDAPTVQLVRGSALVEPTSPFELWGKAEPLDAYRLLDVVVAPTRRHVTAFVGRAPELTFLRDAWDHVREDRRCELVTVVGEAGVGKSRLVAEFLHSIDPLTVRGRCLPYGDGITYWPVVEVLNQLDAVPGDPAVAAPIDALLGSTTAPTSADEIAWAFRKTLEHAAAERSLVVVFDDIQWGEQTFLDLIEHVALLSSGASILLVCMARPELTEHRSDWPLALRLDGLGDEDVDALIPAAMPEELRRRISRAAGGNPLFVEEMLAVAEDADGEAVVPPTLRALLGARLDQLDAAERRVLELAAVEGEVFHRGAVQALSPDDTSVTPRLAALVRRRLIRPEPPHLVGEDGFVFRHLLIRDAAYDSLPKATRADLHLRLATWVQRREADPVELDEIIGYHLEQAYRYRVDLGSVDEHTKELARQAASHFLRSAKRAHSRGDIQGARALLGHCLPITEGPDHVRALLLLADAVTALGDYGEGLRVASEARRKAADLGDTRLDLRSQLMQVAMRGHVDTSYTNARAQDDAAHLLAEFEACGDEESRNRTLIELGRLTWYDGQVGRALEISERLYSYADQMSPRDRTSIALGFLAGAYEGSIPLEERIALLERARTVLGYSAMGEAVICTFTAAVLGLAGKFDEARRSAARAWDAWAELGNPVRRTMSYALIGGMERLAGNLDEAARLFHHGHELLTEAGETLFNASAAIDLADVLCDLGRFDEAETLVRGNRHLATAGQQDVWLRGALRMIEARVLSSRGEHTAALLAADDAVALSEGSEYGEWHCDAHEMRGRVLANAGRTDEARAEYDQALSRYRRSGVHPAVERVQSEICTLVG
jgi:tetratricopeptide (TPR) repeat protein